MRIWVLFSLDLRKVSSSYKTYCESYCKNKEAWIGVDKPHFKSSIVKSQGVSTSSLAKNLNPVLNFLRRIIFLYLRLFLRCLMKLYKRNLKVSILLILLKILQQFIWHLVSLKMMKDLHLLY